ncbi:hypothetical protein [Nitrincola alkalilacustris]|uniref:hypothetical protein n=1 Tax=Nitrincola alkalilacustris TaxID=1571224 RepID=UPI00124BF3B1|nr:hypothetical protein [Nitrincola alkalilacustris]
MPKRVKSWNAAQVLKMNEEAFMVEVLDMIKFSPDNGEDDMSIAQMKAKLDAVEEALELRLNAKQTQ